MQIMLNVIDVFNAAIMMEERGARFYDEAAAFASGAAQKLLYGLATMENGHAAYFRKILAGLENRLSARAEETTEEAAAYLQALTADRIITDECRLETGDTYPQILEKAMLIEKNSVFFYTSVKNVLSGAVAPGEIDGLIGEELGHFKMLSDALLSWQKQSKSL